MAKCRLTERITFIEEVVTQNEGFENKTINDVATFWAARKDISGKERSLEEFKGKVLLIVNIASKCGFTPQLEGLQKIYDEYKNQGLEIIGFPCNQFDNQTPENNNDLNKFCQLNYGVNFNLSEKIDVRGENADPIFTYLVNECPFKGFDKDNATDKLLYSITQENYPEYLIGNSIKWNFTKFLIDKEGKVINRYESRIEPIDIAKDIKGLL